jgi:hypothetical protein
MQQDSTGDRKLILNEGIVDWIMERDTPAERLAAWDTIVAIAFPEEGVEYVPPTKAPRGKILSVEDRVRRDVYNLFAGVLKGNTGVVEDRNDYHKAYIPENQIPFNNPRCSLPSHLSATDKMMIEEWDHKIPDVESLQQYLQTNYFYANKPMVVSLDFCAYAYHKLAVVDRWISTKTKTPFREINRAIHYLALTYIKTTGEIKRAENEERRKDIESEFAMESTVVAHLSASEMASRERRESAKAERLFAERLLKGKK